MTSTETPKLTNLHGRATLVWSEGLADVEELSDQRFSHDTGQIFRDWSRFEHWARAQEPQLQGVPEPEAFGPPVAHPSQIFAVGLNYRDHAAEAGYDTSGRPQIFTKFASCLTGPYATVTVASPRLDYEVELVVVIGRTGSAITEADAWSHVAGLMIGQDLSARDVQLTGQAPQWSLGKSFPGFGPVGPGITFSDDLANRDDLAIGCELNGKQMQSDRTSNMIWSVPELVARISSVCELRAGDLIFTGTPSGIGNRRNPPLYLRPGDSLISRIAGLGELSNSFIAPKTRIRA